MVRFYLDRVQEQELAAGRRRRLGACRPSALRQRHEAPLALTAGLGAPMTAAAATDQSTSGQTGYAQPQLHLPSRGSKCTALWRDYDL